jgi:hypothetical protein
MEITDVLEAYAYASFGPKIDPTGPMRAKMNISLRRRALSLVRFVLKKKG